MRLSPPGTHFAAELTEEMRTKSLAQGHNILMSGVELSTSVIWDILVMSGLIVL